MYDEKCLKNVISTINSIGSCDLLFVISSYRQIIDVLDILVF